MFIAWIVFHVIVCIALILVVLMQSSKGEGLAGTAFSGGMSGAVFGGRGAASFLSKATTALAIIFMFNCGALALMSAQRSAVASGVPGEDASSVVTQQAQQELEQQMQMQQQLQADSAAVTLEDLGVQQPADSAGN